MALTDLIMKIITTIKGRVAKIKKKMAALGLLVVSSVVPAGIAVDYYVIPQIEVVNLGEITKNEYGQIVKEMAAIAKENDKANPITTHQFQIYWNLIRIESQKCGGQIYTPKFESKDGKLYFDSEYERNLLGNFEKLGCP